VLLDTWIFAPPQAGEKDERRFEKRNLCSLVPRLHFHVSVFWSHAKSRAVLGGTLGENAAWFSGHGSSAQADGLSPAAGPARHVVLCGHRSVLSSPPEGCFLREANVRLLTFFHEPLALSCLTPPSKLRRRVGGDAAGAVLSHSTLPGSMKYGQDRVTATLRPQSS
jgi:hypothetical protein